MQKIPHSKHGNAFSKHQTGLEHDVLANLKIAEKVCFEGRRQARHMGAKCHPLQLTELVPKGDPLPTTPSAWDRLMPSSMESSSPAARGGAASLPQVQRSFRVKWHPSGAASKSDRSLGLCSSFYFPACVFLRRRSGPGIAHPHLCLRA